MSLPNLPQKDNYRREVRTEWGGINLNENAGDGELIEAMNMSSREYPLLATARRKHKLIPAQMLSPYGYNGEFGYVEWISDGYYLYDPFHTGLLTKIPAVLGIADLQYAVIGSRMVIAQSKQIHDFTDGTTKYLEAAFDSGAETVIFRDGTLGGVPAAGNTIYCPGADWADDFSVGDAVSISGSGLPENNKTAIIREIEGDELRFSENCFTVADDWHLYLYEPMPAGRYYFYTDGDNWRGFDAPAAIPASVTLHLDGNSIKYQAPGQAPVSLPTFSGDTPSGTEVTFLPPADADHITLSRTVPDMDFVCVNENRVWGCKGDTIYCSKLGDPYNWNVFDGLSTDSWTAETGTQGEFTGCCSFQGYPTFFKEGAVFKVLGDEPQNMILRKQNIVGVRAGSHHSIVEIHGHLYYLSNVGFMRWNGGDYPQSISDALGREPNTMGGAVAGTDGLRYYVYLVSDYRYDESVPAYMSDPPGPVYTYDVRYGAWHKLSGPSFLGTVRFVCDPSHCWMFYIEPETYDPETGYDHGVYYELHNTIGWAGEASDWRVTFADSTRAYKTALTGSESKKGVLRLLIRCRLAGSMKVWISYDGGEFEQAGEFGGEDGLPKTSRVVPLILRRCDFWQLRLTGTGDAVIYSIAVERYGGEWQQA